MDKTLIAAGAQLVTGTLYLEHRAMGHYRNGQFIATPEGAARAQVLQAEAPAAPAAKKAATRRAPAKKAEAPAPAPAEPVEAAPEDLGVDDLSETLAELDALDED